jgi:hypothetical protein
MVVISTFVQELIVGAAALAAAAYVVHRVVAMVRPAPAEPACDSCSLQSE